MAKLSSVNKNNRRIKLSNQYFLKRQKLKKIIMDKKIIEEERFKALLKLSKLPRNSAKYHLRVCPLNLLLFKEKYLGILFLGTS